MTYTRVPEMLAKLAVGAAKSTRFVAVAMVGLFISLALEPAHAQSSDTWKSIAIIGGSTAAGAYVGHKIGGSTGALVGAGVGASVGYSIDRRRRQNEYNQYSDNGYYGNDGGYYGNDGGSYGNDGGYYGGPYNGGASPYPSGYQSSSYRNTSSDRCSSRR